jgi:hypothetical protein
MFRFLAHAAWWPLRVFAFWMLFFAAFRGWFLVQHVASWPAGQAAERWQALRYAWPLDVSMAGYLTALPLLGWWAGVFLPERASVLLSRLVLAYNVLIISVLVLVFGINIFLYEEWKTPFNRRVIDYFDSPLAVLNSLSWPFLVGCVVLYGGAVWAAAALYRRVVHPHFSFSKNKKIPYAWVLSGLLWVVLCVVGIRGVGVMPINESAVYRSTNLATNHAAVNVGWYFGHSLVEARTTTNRYRWVPQDSVAAYWPKSLREGQPESVSYLGFDGANRPDSARMNVVFLLMESMTAQVVAELGGEPGITPNLSRLIGEGVLYDRIYASGFRTDQGLVAVLGGYPAQPDQSIIFHPDKVVKLTGVANVLKINGYSTAFFHGSDMTFANMGLWLRHAGFDKLYAEGDFPTDLRTQRWGVDDLSMLTTMCNQMDALPQPFCVGALTMSLHAPFDVPEGFESRWKNATTTPDQFRHAAAFADYALGEFFRKAATKPWFGRTVFVLVADHGHPMPGNIGNDMAASHHVPLVVWSAALPTPQRGTRCSVIGGHHDLPAMVLPRLTGRPTWEKEFPWSRNLDGLWAWKQTEKLGFTYFTHEDGVGWVTERGAGFFNFKNKKWYDTQGKLSPTDQTKALGYLSWLYDDYLGL